jgi:hypothetical protein
MTWDSTLSPDRPDLQCYAVDEDMSCGIRPLDHAYGEYALLGMEIKTRVLRLTSEADYRQVEKLI